MKVLFISSGNNANGISPIILSQGESLRKKGIALEYFLIKGKGLQGYLKNIGRLRRYLQNNKFDIIHAHYGLCGIVALLARPGQKVVVSLMGSDLLGNGYKKDSLTFFSKIIIKANIILSRFSFSYTIVKSNEMLKKVKKTNNKSLVANGVDIDKFDILDKEISLAKAGFEKSKQNIIFVSNPSRAEKNYDLAKKAVSHLNNKDIELHVLKNIKHKELAYYYNAADVLLLTSYYEGSPNVIKEAMACNCPIVSTDVGDIRWIFGKTQGCYLANFDSNDVAGKLKTALEFSRTEGRTKGREKIMESGLDDETIANRIISIYESVLQSKAAPNLTSKRNILLF